MGRKSKHQAGEGAAAPSEESTVEEKLAVFRSWHESLNLCGVPSATVCMESGVLEVELQDYVEPEFIREDKTYRIESRGGADLHRFHKVLEKYGFLSYEPTFRISRDVADKLREIAREQGMTVSNLNSFATVYFAPDADVGLIAEALTQEVPEILRAAPVPKGVPPSSGPGDVLLGNSEQVVTNPTTQLDNQWYVFRCRANRVWEMSLSGRGVVIAMLDHGVWVTHFDIADRLDKKHRHNSVDETDDVSQGFDIFHGTGVAGLVGAAANDFGMVGFAYEAELWPVQANFSRTVEVPSNISWANAITWALTTDSCGKRKVILFENQTCMKGNYEEVASVNAGIRTAIAHGIVVCVAAGNGDRDAGIADSGGPITDTGSILVGATLDNNGVNERWTCSNWGDRVTVSAPGDPQHDVTCLAFVNDRHGNLFGGTSGAAAKVAGAAALMLEANPYIRHSDVREILSRTGTHVVTDADKPVGYFLDCEAAVIAARKAPAWGTAWRQLPGSALDLVFAPDGSAWHLGDDRVIYQWDERGWRWRAHGAAVGAVKIAVGASESPWYIDSAGRIFRWVKAKWAHVPGQALDIDAGADGSIWHVGADRRMYCRRDGKWKADGIHGSAVKLAVGPDGSPWHIGAAGEIYRKEGKTWRQVPGQALDIAIGADGSVWRVCSDKTGVDNAMYRWNGSDWEPIDGASTMVAVAPNGLPWHVNRSGNIFRRV
jgi:subtilisin family serine protease